MTIRFLQLTIPGFVVLLVGLILAICLGLLGYLWWINQAYHALEDETSNYHLATAFHCATFKEELQRMVEAPASDDHQGVRQHALDAHVYRLLESMETLQSVRDRYGAETGEDLTHELLGLMTERARDHLARVVALAARPRQRADDHGLSREMLHELTQFRLAVEQLQRLSLIQYREHVGRLSLLKSRDTVRLAWLVGSLLLVMVAVAAGVVSHIRRLVRGQQEAERATQIASQAKSRFLANMSHEIRTPLNAVIGMTELLRESTLTAEQTRYVEVCHRSGETLLNLVNDILDISKVEGGQLVIEATPFALGDVLDNVCGVMGAAAEDKGLRFTCQRAQDLPTHLVGDAMRLRQILFNLLGNAVKFTDHGEVVLQVEESGRAATTQGEQWLLTFSVRDSGIGIAADKLTDIFEIFTQEENATSRKQGGTGLGLAITRRLVTMMDGQIEVQSQLGRGSTFRVVLPFALAPAATQESLNQVAPRLAGVAAIVVEQDLSSRVVCRELLLWMGCSRVEAVAEPGRALTLLREAQENGWSYGLLVLEMGEQGGECKELLQNLRALAPGLPVLLVAAEREVFLHKVCPSPMVVGHLIKPLKRELLARAVAGVMASRGSVLTVATGALRILLVEDAPDNQLLIRSFLKNSPHLLETAANGVEGVERFQQREYDLVLMDIQMPIMDGYEATRRIRAFEQEQGRSRIPILALTAYALGGDAAKSLAAGCDAHLTKPIKKNQLLSALAEYGHAAVPASRRGNGKRRLDQGEAG